VAALKLVQGEGVDLVVAFFNITTSVAARLGISLGVETQGDVAFWKFACTFFKSWPESIVIQDEETLSLLQQMFLALQRLLLAAAFANRELRIAIEQVRLDNWEHPLISFRRWKNSLTWIRGFAPSHTSSDFGSMAQDVLDTITARVSELGLRHDLYPTQQERYVNRTLRHLEFDIYTVRGFASIIESDDFDGEGDAAQPGMQEIHWGGPPEVELDASEGPAVSVGFEANSPDVSASASQTRSEVVAQDLSALLGRSPLLSGKGLSQPLPRHSGITISHTAAMVYPIVPSASPPHSTVISDAAVGDAIATQERDRSPTSELFGSSEVTDGGAAVGDAIATQG
jgi:hypothetical protein